jgi:ketosteroid isomerase-like protein
VESRGGAARGVRRGGLRKRDNRGFENWERIELRADEYLDAGEHDVVVFHHEIAKGRQSGVIVETDTASINTVRGGRIVCVRPYLDRRQALDAAGLP